MTNSWETEVATLCEILKDKDNYKTLLKGNIINDDDIKKLDNLYNDLDTKISEPLKPILSQIHESDKSKKEKEDLKTKFNDEFVLMSSVIYNLGFLYLSMKSDYEDKLKQNKGWLEMERIKQYNGDY